MHAKNQAGACSVIAFLIIFNARAIGRPHLAQARVPELCMISGMRKPSPISINSPRDTITSPSAASSRKRKIQSSRTVIDGTIAAAPSTF